MRFPGSQLGSTLPCCRRVMASRRCRWIGSQSWSRPSVAMATQIFRWRMTAHQSLLSISATPPLRADMRTDLQRPGSIPLMPSETPDARSDSTLIVDTGFRHTPPAQSPRLTRWRISIDSRLSSSRLSCRLVPEVVFAAVREITMRDQVLRVLAGDRIERCGRGHTVDSHQNHPASNSVCGVLICIIEPTELQSLFVVRPQNTQVRNPLPTTLTLGHSIETSTDSHVIQGVVDQKLVAPSLVWLLVHRCVLSVVKASIVSTRDRPSAGTTNIPPSRA